jgi:hypothetical protein
MHELPPINAQMKLKEHQYNFIITVIFFQDTPPRQPCGFFREEVPIIAALQIEEPQQRSLFLLYIFSQDNQ